MIEPRATRRRERRARRMEVRPCHSLDNIHSDADHFGFLTIPGEEPGLKDRDDGMRRRESTGGVERGGIYQKKLVIP